MTTIKMIEEEEAEGKVKDVYAEIKETFGIDFVPNLYKVMAPNPAYLEANWNKVKAVMIESGEPRPLDQGDHRGRCIGSKQLRLLTARPHFCGAEVGIERRGRSRVDGGRRPVQRLQQADGRSPG